MLVLAFDTALERIAVGLSDGRRLAVRRALEAGEGRADHLFNLIEAVLEDARLSLEAVERLAVTIGPGRFTGIRAGLAAARGLALAMGCPLIGIDSLRALAASLDEPPEGPVLAAIDARRGEVYAALYSPEGEVLVPPFLDDMGAAFARCADAAIIIGSGAPLLVHHAITHGLDVPRSHALTGIDPLALARLARGDPPPTRAPVPLYLRAPDAKAQRPLSWGGAGA